MFNGQERRLKKHNIFLLGNLSFRFFCNLCFIPVKSQEDLPLQPINIVQKIQPRMANHTFSIPDTSNLRQGVTSRRCFIQKKIVQHFEKYTFLFESYMRTTQYHEWYQSSHLGKKANKRVCQNDRSQIGKESPCFPPFFF